VDVIPRDAADLRTAYQRLTDKFRTLWVFHQFLEGLAAALPSGGVAETSAAFTPLYEQIKKVKEGRGALPDADLLAEVQRLDVALDGLHTTLLLEDRKVPPHLLRQFFERSGRDDDRELVPLLKFYFFARQLQPDELDKVDFLLTRVGTRRLKDGGLEVKPAEELAELCGTFLTLTGREEADPAEVRSVLSILDVLRKDIEACGRFEDLIRKKPLENIRTLKRRMGNAFYTAEVLQSLLASNVAAKRKFQALYRQEEEQILATSKRLLDLEAELALDARFQTDEFQVDFRRFRRERDDFEKQSKRRGVRPRDVRRLKEAIHRILLRIEPAAAAEFDTTFDSTAGASKAPLSARGEPDRTPETPPPPRPPPPAAPEGTWKAEADPLTSSAAERILHSADLAGTGVGPGRASASGVLRRLRLEPWEVRAALELAHRDETPSRPEEPLGRLLFNAASLRLRMDEEACDLRGAAEPEGTAIAEPGRLEAAGACLRRAQEVDWLFRASLAEADARRQADLHLQLTRSRFRHLRAYTGLWLLHNALGG
jgi:hypothetical protein